MTLLHAFGMLLIVATVLLTLAALAGLAGTLSSRKPGAALGVAGGLAAWYALVVGFVGAVSLLQPGRSLAPGEVKRFCGFYLDCHLGAAVVGRQRVTMIGDVASRGVFEVLTLEISSDARAEPMRPYGVQAALVGPDGARYARDGAAEAAWERQTGHSASFDQEVPPNGGAFHKDLIFDVPRDSGALALDVRESAFPDDVLEWFLAGDEDSFLHPRTLLRLPEGPTCSEAVR